MFTGTKKFGLTDSLIDAVNKVHESKKKDSEKVADKLADAALDGVLKAPKGVAKDAVGDLPDGKTIAPKKIGAVKEDTILEGADKEPKYNKDAVDKSIKASKPKIGKAEGKKIHALLKGWRGNAVKEEEEITELSKNTLDSYVQGAAHDLLYTHRKKDDAETEATMPNISRRARTEYKGEAKALGAVAAKRGKGIAMATKKLVAKESVEDRRERLKASLTEARKNLS